MEFNILNYNVSHAALIGARPSGKAREFRYLDSKGIERIFKGPLPCSKFHRKNIGFKNIVKYLIEYEQQFSLINLVEATNDVLLSLAKEGILNRKSLIIGAGVSSREALYQLFDHTKFTPLTSLTVCISDPTEKNSDGSNKVRPVLITLFNELILVSVHLPHSKSEKAVNQSILNVLDRIFIDYRSLPILITGDFNNEADFSEFASSDPSLKTNYLFVETCYEDKPQQFGFDRFAYNQNKLNLTEINLHTPDPFYKKMKRLEMSDHIPIHGKFTCLDNVTLDVLRPEFLNRGTLVQFSMKIGESQLDFSISNNKLKLITHQTFQLPTISSLKPRPWFFTNDGQQIMSGGALFYRTDQNSLEFLVMKVGKKFCDLGGKTESSDIDIKATISREVEEETDGLFKRAEVLIQLQTAHFIYYPQCKYVLAFINCSAFQSGFDTPDFKKLENGTENMRTFSWIDGETLFDLKNIKKLHPRITKDVELLIQNRPRIK